MKLFITNKDGDRANNNPDNLELKTRSEHSYHHWPVVSTSEDVGIDHSQFVKIKDRIPELGKIKYKNGYALVFDPQNKMCDLQGYVFVQRKMMAEHLGRELLDNETVIFLNGDRTDLRIENLRILNRIKPPRQHTYVPREPKANAGFKVDNGYMRIWNPQHPMAAKDGYALEHRIVMSQHLGRILSRDEFVHHKNGNRLDNRIENLEIVSRHDHPPMHLHMKKKDFEE